MFPKNGVDMTNISQYVADAGQATQEFFNDVIKVLMKGINHHDHMNQL